MHAKLDFISIILTLVLALAACAPSANQGRSLTVTGTGTVYLTPDIAYISIGVHTENADITQAVESNNSQAQAVVDPLRNSGIEAKDLQTSNLASVQRPGRTRSLAKRPGRLMR